jgi:GNAT superfamily N-acetyltransferase
MYVIKEAAPDDAAAIIQLAEETWWPTYSPLIEKEQIAFMLGEIYTVPKISAQIENGSQAYLLLSEGEQPVAFASYSPREENPDIYKLHKIYCLPATQGKGYGKVLIDAVVDKVSAAGKHLLELNVNRQNSAKIFYEKMGFTIAYEEDVAIGPYWMNDYVMRKEF